MPTQVRVVASLTRRWHYCPAIPVKSNAEKLASWSFETRRTLASVSQRCASIQTNYWFVHVASALGIYDGSYANERTRIRINRIRNRAGIQIATTTIVAILFLEQALVDVHEKNIGL